MTFARRSLHRLHRSSKEGKARQGSKVHARVRGPPACLAPASPAASAVPDRLPSPLSCAGACSPLGARAQGSRPAACPQSHDTPHWRRRRRRQRHAWTLLYNLTLAASCAGSGAGTLRARMPHTVTARHPGSGLGTLRARMLAQALLCCSAGAASHSGSRLGTLRARMHVQVLLCATMVATSRPGSGVGTLRAGMLAQTLACGTLAAVSRPGSGAGTLACADPAVGHHGRRKLFQLRRGYPASAAPVRCFLHGEHAQEAKEPANVTSQGLSVQR